MACITTENFVGSCKHGRNSSLQRTTRQRILWKCLVSTMKIKGVQIVHKLFDSELTITTEDKGGLQVIYDAIGDINPEAEYEITIKKKTKKRSLRSNNYMWALLGELAVKIRNSSIELYKHFIRHYGHYDAILLPEETIEGFEEAWGMNGIAWFVEDVGECRTMEGYHTVLAYYGSHTYDTKQMSRLIEEVVYECKEQGIETMTPAELEQMLKEEEEYEQRNSGRKAD